MRPMPNVPLIDFQNVTVQRGERVVLDSSDTLHCAGRARGHPRPSNT